MEINKFGVPHHYYKLFLNNGTTKEIDVGDESDWGNIQDCNPEDCDPNTDDWMEAIGYGNDCDGHVKILKVVDCDTEKVWEGNLEVREWATDKVWKYIDNYSE